MKKQLILTTAMAATLSSLSGCSSGDDWDGTEFAENDTGVCVDQSGYRVDDDYCDDDGVRRSGGFGWFYIARGGRIPYKGDSIKDKKYGFIGSTTPDPGKVYGRSPSAANMTRSASIARGGFGSSSRSFGGGRS